jgi:hypothetical protein
MQLILSHKRTMSMDDGTSVSQQPCKSLKIKHDSEGKEKEPSSISVTHSSSQSTNTSVSEPTNDATDKDNSQERMTSNSSPCPSNETEQDNPNEEDDDEEEHEHDSNPNKDMEHELSKLDPRKNDTCKGMSPDLYIQKLFGALLGFSPMSRPTLELSSLSYNESNAPFISPITEEDMANYDVDIVTATRDEELETLRSMYEQGRTLSCCNRYGESLLHMACRRGFTDIVKFLVQEANVQIRVTDDCGRTPMHDALWNRDCQFGIVDLLLNLDPSLFLLCDKHGHTPFMYARREHWDVWKQFLWDRREHIKNAMDNDVMNLFKIDL